MSGFIEVVDAAEQLAGGPNCSDEEFEMWVGLLRANLLRLGALAPSTGNFLSFLPPTGPWVPVTQLDLDCNRYCGDGALRLRIPVARFDAWCVENGFRPQAAAPTVDAPDAPRASNSAPVKRPPPQQRHQEQEILRVLAELGADPLAVSPWTPDAPGIKAQTRDRLPYTRDQFNKAWQRLRKEGRLREAE